MTTVLMYDSIRVAGIPASALIVAGYLDGTYDNWAALTAKFSKVPKVAVDVNGSSPGAEARDWETGDKGGNLEQWVIQHNKLSGKQDAVIYCNRSTIAEVRKLTGSQVLGKDYYLWVATGDGTIYSGAGVVACQYKWTNDYDVSQVYPTPNVWWTGGKPAVGSTPPPVAPPAGPDNNWFYPPVRNLTALSEGKTTVKLSWNSPEQPANEAPLPGISEYEIAMSSGTHLLVEDPSYARYTPKASNPQVWEGGSLAPGTHTAGVRALGPTGHNAGPWATVTFTI